MKRFVVTGSGRSGTQYMAKLLSATGVRCGHESVYYDTGFLGWKKWEADSSWLAACFVPLNIPTVLVVRHPLSVVRSWVETWLSHDPRTPRVPVLRKRFPEVYKYPKPHDRALAQWLLINRTCRQHAVATYLLEEFSAAHLVSLLATVDRSITLQAATQATARVTGADRYAARRTGLKYTPDWCAHDRNLAAEAREFARALGYGDMP